MSGGSISPKNLFLSHNWGSDLRGRDTHARVKEIKEHLVARRWKVWFDEEQLLLGSNIDVKMASGIRCSDAVCICITRAYVEKVNGQDRADNCAKEWNFAQATGKRILPLIMEHEMLDIKAWPPGVMSMYLGNCFYLDCSGEDTKEISERLGTMLKVLGLKPRLVKPSHSWPITRSTRRGKLQMSRTTIRI